MTQLSNGRAAALALSGVLALCALGCRHEEGPMRGGAMRHHGFTSDQTVVQVVSTNVQGKNVFIPATIAVVAPGPVTLQVHNTTDVPHGFNIDGLDVQEIVEGGSDLEVTLDELEGHRVYRVECHLHMPHRSATLVVLPGPH